MIRLKRRNKVEEQRFRDMEDEAEMKRQQAFCDYLENLSRDDVPHMTYNEWVEKGGYRG